MRMRARVWGLAALGVAGVASAQGRASCSSAVFEGEVSAGKSFEQVFAPGLKFLLEPIASGWIVRVLPVGEPRGAHDDAELATPPYRSVTPLAVSTDFSFRAQDAVGWNPRHFRYAATGADFRAMRGLYDAASRGDANAERAMSEIAARQPEAELRILDAHLVPGTNDQAQMAAGVASHFESTPHSEEANGASALGKVTWMRFRVGLDLLPGVKPAKGIREEKKFCNAQPTRQAAMASQLSSPARKK